MQPGQGMNPGTSMPGQFPQLMQMSQFLPPMFNGGPQSQMPQGGQMFRQVGMPGQGPQMFGPGPQGGMTQMFGQGGPPPGLGQGGMMMGQGGMPQGLGQMPQQMLQMLSQGGMQPMFGQDHMTPQPTRAGAQSIY